jgi:hypothetical protein
LHNILGYNVTMSTWQEHWDGWPAPSSSIDVEAIQDGLDWLWGRLHLHAPRLLILETPVECAIAANLMDQPRRPRSKPVCAPLPDEPLIREVRRQMELQLPDPPRVHPANFRAYDFEDKLREIRIWMREPGEVREPERVSHSSSWYDSRPELGPFTLQHYPFQDLASHAYEYLLHSGSRLLGEAILGGAWMVIAHPKVAIVCRAPGSQWEAAASPRLARAQLERLGLPAFLQQSPQRLLDQDFDLSGMPRRLLRVRMENDEPLVVVEVQCPTTGKHSWLRVPPQTQRCSEAVAWTFGFSAPEAYQPAFES